MTPEMKEQVRSEARKVFTFLDNMHNPLNPLDSYATALLLDDITTLGVYSVSMKYVEFNVPPEGNETRRYAKVRRDKFARLHIEETWW